MYWSRYASTSGDIAPPDPGVIYPFLFGAAAGLATYVFTTALVDAPLVGPLAFGILFAPGRLEIVRLGVVDREEVVIIESLGGRFGVDLLTAKRVARCLSGSE